MKNIGMAVLAAAALLVCGELRAQEVRDPKAGLKKRAASAAAETKKEHKGSHQTSPKAEARKVAPEEIGKEAACAVTGEKFKVAADTISMSYKGKNYYFCCPGCDKSFAKDPEKFLSKKPAAAAKKYACPMGEYESDKPGRCPKCGMDLKEKK